jgi:hypothetical protein
MKIPSETLRELHSLHRQLAELRARLARGPRQVKAAEASVQQREQELAQSKATVTKSRVAVDQKELQLKEREGRVADVKRKLNSAKTNREYQTFLEQVAADEQANSVLSDEILDLYDKIAAEQKEAQRADANLLATRSELDKIRKRVEGERDSLEADLGRLALRLRDAENQLPSDIRGDYDRIVKARGDEALAPVDGECCGGCFQQITSQMVNELKLSQFVACKSCGRILYLPK